MIRRRKFFILLLFCLSIVLGFLREFIFLNINEQMRVIYYNTPDSRVSPLFGWLSHFSYAQLYYGGKWPLTLFFMCTFALLTVVIVRLAFQTTAYTKYVLWAYTCVFALSLLIYLMGDFTNSLKSLYPISRFLAGSIESPMLLLVIYAGLTYVHRIPQ
jgi:hypothetical protein